MSQKFKNLNLTDKPPINFSEVSKTSANKIKMMNWDVNSWKKLDSTAIKILLLAMHLKYFYLTKN